MTSQCERCGRRFNVIEKGLCYYCHVEKYGVPPNTGMYHIEKEEEHKR